jgi:hypothetical protein
VHVDIPITVRIDVAAQSPDLRCQLGVGIQGQRGSERSPDQRVSINSSQHLRKLNMTAAIHIDQGKNHL